MKKKVLIIIAKYYDNISNNLSVGAQTTLDMAKIKYSIKEVPGIFEIPVVISRNIKKYDAFIALGCVIKGETPHFDYISKTTFDGLMKLSIENKKPIGNGIITALNKDQASARCGSNKVVRSHGRVDRLHHKKSGKGEEAANAVIAVLSK